MKHFLLLTTSALTLITCTPQNAERNTDSVTQDSVHVDAVIKPEETMLQTVPDTAGQCYTYNEKGEQRFMRIWQEGITVHGELELKWDNKREVSGSFEGTAINDTLWIMHKFVSEGKTMRREMVYIRSGDKLYEGQGMQETKDNFTFTFKNKQRLEFSKDAAMVKAKCK